MKKSILVGIVVAAVVLAVGAALFQPWRAFTNTTVDEALPSVAPTSSASAAPKPKTLAKGSFIDHEHATTGTVKIVELPNGERVLRLVDLDTSDGPDLKVWITDAPVIPGRDGWGVFDDGEYVDLGALKGNRGNQNYALPKSVDLDELTSVSIWCDRFNVSFGAAELTTVKA